MNCLSSPACGYRNQHPMRAKALFLLPILFFNLCVKAQFSLGHLVVLQIGNGTNSLSGTGNALVLKEFNTSGTATYSVPVTSTGTNALVLRGNGSTEGYISKSADGNYIVVGGYNMPLPNSGTTALNAIAPSNLSRGIGLVNSAGQYSLAALVSSGFAAGDIRGACASNSANVWGSSSSQGLGYYGPVSPSIVQNSKTNLRAAHIFNGQLYLSSQVATGTPSNIGVFAVGSGTPNTNAQTVVSVINTGSVSQPGQFYFNAANTICYVADSRNSGFGGIQKWVYAANTWSLAYTLPTGTTLIGAFGVVADFSGLNPKVYATTTESTNNRLVAINDLGANSTATTIATATLANSIFRGLAFSPVNSTCVPVSVTAVNFNSLVCSAQSLSFDVITNGSAPISYTWAGAGNFNSNAINNPLINNPITGPYSFTATNACGSTSAAINISVYPSPTLVVAPVSICIGGTATLTASGASTYTWSNNTNQSSITLSPLTNTTFTVKGTSAAGCTSNPVSTTVTVVNSLSLQVNSASLCAGSSATLNASGATSYTWNSGQLSNSIVVSPLSNSQYTVSGSSPGCSLQAFAVASVSVFPLPTMSLTLDTLMCISQQSIALSGLPSGGIYTGSFVTGPVFSPTATGVYTIAYNYTTTAGCSNNAQKSCTVSACQNLAKINTYKLLHLFPNPADKYVRLQFTKTGHHHVMVYDANSKLILKLDTDQEYAEIDISELCPGVYYIILNGDKTVKTRFVKQ